MSLLCPNFCPSKPSCAPCDPCCGPCDPCCGPCGLCDPCCGPCIPIKCCKSRELRGSVLIHRCNCTKRNGLQHDCPRSECQVITVNLFKFKILKLYFLRANPVA